MPNVSPTTNASINISHKYPRDANTACPMPKTNTIEKTRRKEKFVSLLNRMLADTDPKIAPADPETKERDMVFMLVL